MGLTCSLGPTFLLGFLKLYFFKVSLQSFFFPNFFKSFFKLGNWKRFLTKKRRINQRRKWQTSLWRLRLQRQNICKSLHLSLSFNFWTFSLECFCNFSAKLSFAQLLVKNENKKVFYIIISFYKVTFHFSLQG